MATFTTIKFGDGLGVTDEGSGVIRVDSASGGGTAGGGASATDTTAWLPLTTTNSSGDDVLVYDANHSLIPTLIPF